jgi:serpin B
MVNRLWVEKTFTLKRSYKKLMRNAYQSSFRASDFVNKPDESRLAINADISKQTRDKIKDLLPPNSVDTRTRLIITNAIYFKAKWEIPFEKEKTRDGDFFITPAEKVKCPMMNLKDDFNYFEDTQFEALELPYKDTSYSLIILLPGENSNLADFENSLSPSKINSIRESMGYESIRVSIPKFKFSEGYQLKKNLIEMGMPEAFSMDADFSNMSGKNDLKITDVYHQAFVDVSEEGTEAAAATAIVVGVKSIGRDKFFIANRPFIFLIVEKKTNTFLFMGRVSNPTEK